MPKKIKGTKMCPADYDHADQTDSDHHEDPDYIYEEPTSPKISQAKGCDTYKKRQNEKNQEIYSNHKLYRSISSRSAIVQIVGRG